MPHSYSAASGQAIYGGLHHYPSWRPAPGTFAEIGLNTVNDIRPSGWPNGDTISPFGAYGGGTLLTDFSDLGGIAYHGGGHPASSTNPLWGGVIMLDLVTRLMSMRNVPPAPLIADTSKYNNYGESQDPSNAGHTWAPHSYSELIPRPAAMGGGPKGSLLRVNFTIGSGLTGTPTHEFDVSSATAAAVRKIDAMPDGQYSMPAYDSTRKGFWFLAYNGNGPLQFYKYNNDGSIAAPVTYSSVQFNAFGNGSMVHIPERDCLVSIMQMSNTRSDLAIFVCPIVSGVPQGFTQVAVSGAGPNDARCGLSWCAPLNVLIGYEGNGSLNVHKLALPTGSLTGSGWAWTHETMTGVGGITPSNNGQGAGSWGRMIYVPAAGCCIWNDSVFTKPQAFTLTGM